MKKMLLGLFMILAITGVGFFAFVWRSEKLEEEKAERFYEMRQAASLSEENPGEIPVDFEALQKRNPDIYAWITIPGTAMDAPVLQRKEDVSYYLAHNWKGEEDPNGAVCSESAYNGLDFEDVHTVLYGNNCRDGSLFGSLSAFEDERFFKENPLIVIYTPKAIYYYKIFAAYEYDSRHLLESFDLSTPRALEKYVEGVLDQRNLYAQLLPDITVGEGDRILTLSTGSGRENGGTYLVQGLLKNIYLW